MNLTEIQHRDRILRTYIEGRNWDKTQGVTAKLKPLRDGSSSDRASTKNQHSLLCSVARPYL
ncbi:MAG TPA: hypothetical protein V6C65_11145 [Allocoleopsis sp.]